MRTGPTDKVGSLAAIRWPRLFNSRGYLIAATTEGTGVGGHPPDTSLQPEPSLPTVGEEDGRADESQSRVTWLDETAQEDGDGS